MKSINSKEVTNFIAKCNKKSYKSIKQIINANNMLEVDHAINDAIIDTFGLRNEGLIKIAMRKNSTMMEHYGCVGYKDNFDLLIAVRRYNLDTYGQAIKAYLMTFISEKMKGTHMYQIMVKRAA